MKLTKRQVKEYTKRWHAHNKHLKQSGRHDERLTFNQYVAMVFGKGPKPSGSSSNFTKPGANGRDIGEYKSHGVQNAPADACARKERPKYSGDAVKGIATMHKSNAVPVTGKKQATEIAKMRRG